MREKDDSNYIDAVRFTELLIGYQELGCETTLNALIKECFYPLSIGVLRKLPMHFVDPDDAIQECVIRCVDTIGQFNPDHATVNLNSTGERSRKAFSFFTTCASNTLKGLYRKEMSLQRTKRNYFMDLVDKEHRSPVKAIRNARSEIMAAQKNND